MNRAQLEHAIRAARAIIAADEVIVIGSQSILGSHSEDELPALATLSNGVDIRPVAPSPEETTRLADILEGAAGELSLFHETHGFYLDGVDDTTATLPTGWEQRLVPVRNDNTRGHTGWCLDPHDLCVAKIVAHREKDQAFVAALIEAGLIRPEVLVERVASLDSPAPNRVIVDDWIRQHLDR